MLSGCGSLYLSCLEADGFQGSERHVVLVGELGESADDPAAHAHGEKRGERARAMRQPGRGR